MGKVLESEDGCPMENVGHDGGKENRGENKEKMDARWEMSGMTNRREIRRRTTRRSRSDTGVQVGVKGGDDHVTNTVLDDIGVVCH